MSKHKEGSSPERGCARWLLICQYNMSMETPTVFRENIEVSNSVDGSPTSGTALTD